jgi:hypothetical protein
VNDAPKLLVEWSSPWEEFRTAIGPALKHSPERLAGEARTGLFPYRGILVSWVLESAVLLAVIVLPERFAAMQPYQPPPMPKYDVIYYSGNELPRTADAGGAQTGLSGEAGGQEAYHPTQTIRVARGDSARDKVVDAPKLDLPHSDSAVANLLAYKGIPGPPPAEGLQSSARTPAMLFMPIAPSPSVQRDSLQAPPSLSATVVAPSSNVERDNFQSGPALIGSVIAPSPDVKREKTIALPALNTGVIAPPPTGPQRDAAMLRLPGSQSVQVIAPPVSAPVEATNSNPRLTLPASVIAPPLTQITREVASAGPGFGSGELRKQIVPPPAQLGGGSNERRAFGGVGNGSVVPPPSQLGGVAAGRYQSSAGGGNGLSGNVVPPPVQLAGDVGGTSQSSGGLGATFAGVVPPPLGSIGGSLSGRGRGNRGAGFGGSFDVGDIAAPAKSGATGSLTGVIASDRPGSKIGVPGNGGAGSLALSPSGGDKAGLGGSGGGGGIGRGNGPGSGFSGDGPGAGKGGSGRGSEVRARGGTSQYPGPGGAGSGTNGNPPMPGVDVKGGSSGVINLPGFGTDRNDPPTGGRSANGAAKGGFQATIEASARAGGAFNFYGALKGDKAYTIYFETAFGPAALYYADPSSATHPYSDDLTAPQTLRSDLPADLERSRLVIACILDRSGLLRSTRVIEQTAPDTTTKILAALPNWKFTPALRGQQPVEVNAILGFNIDTKDRF